MTFVEQIIAQNEPIAAVHCMSGNYRTGTLLAIYLIAGETPDLVIERIQQTSPTDKLREPQIYFLHELPQLL